MYLIQLRYVSKLIAMLIFLILINFTNDARTKKGKERGVEEDLVFPFEFSTGLMLTSRLAGDHTLLVGKKDKRREISFILYKWTELRRLDFPSSVSSGIV